MARSWITPKTDWIKSDEFTIVDYNRIRNNLLYINDMLNERYPDKAQPLDLGDAMIYSGDYYPSKFNAFEDALESFTRIGTNVNIGSKKTFKGNDPFIGHNELNRLETCCLRWYNYDPVIHTSSISISPKSQTIKVGETKVFTITYSPSNAEDINNLIIGSSNPNVLTITRSGMNIIATAISVGTATIDVSVYNAFDSASITIEDVLVESIVLEKNDITIFNGTDIDLNYVLLPANANNKNDLRITSSKSSVVSVKEWDENSVTLSGRTAGQAEITFKCGQATSIATVNVLPNATQIWVASVRGDSREIKRTTIYGIGRTEVDYVVTDPIDAVDKYDYSYTISNPQCISVEKNNDVLSITTLAVGESDIHITLDSGVEDWHFNVVVRG